MKAPIDIIAANLPTYLDLYDHPPRVIPTIGRLTKEAGRIMAVLASEGFEIVRRS